MERIGVFDAVSETMERMEKSGVLLVSGERGNPMTIGWGTVGIVWGRPIFTVLVRPSRCSFRFMEGTAAFTVNVMGDRYEKEIALCGSKSGREMDKVAACGFTLARGELAEAPFIAESAVHYECRTVHKTNVINADLEGGIVKHYYPQGDFHRVYFGEILGVFRGSSGKAISR